MPQKNAKKNLAGYINELDKHGKTIGTRVFSSNLDFLQGSIVTRSEKTVDSRLMVDNPSSTDIYNYIYVHVYVYVYYIVYIYI